MKLICIMVSSVNGKTTLGENPHLHQWTSPEDQAYFSKLIEQNNCIIMGRKTYEVAKHMMSHKPGKLRIVITNNPEKYKQDEIPDQLEFTNDSPNKLLTYLTSLNFQTVLLVGGASVNTMFFKENLVNELWLTIEPKIFGKGNGLVAENELDIKLELMSVEKLNPQGTLLLKYRVN